VFVDLEFLAEDRAWMRGPLATTNSGQPSALSTLA